MNKDKKTKILFIMGLMRVGGIEKSLIRLCKALDPQKYEMSVLMLSVGDGISGELPSYVTKFFVSRNKTRSFEPQYSRFWSKHYEKLYEITYQSTNKIKKWINYKILKYETKCFKKYVKQLFAEYAYDICVGFMQGEPSDIAMSCFKAERRVVFYRHGTIFEFMNDTEYYKKADKIIALSKGVKQDLIKKRNLPAERIEIIHNVYDIDSIIEQSKESCVYDSDKRVKIVTVARISPEKGIVEAIKAAKILKDNQIDFLWIFVGKNNGNYYEECKQEIQKNDLNNHVIFTGVQSNPYPLIRTADIYVQPSECESLGNTIVEALVLGKPIVSTNTYGANELLTNGENGLICEITPNDIAKAVQLLVNDEGLKGKLILGTHNSFYELKSEINKYVELFSI